MRLLTKGTVVLAVFSLAVATGACTKGPAEAALKAAEQSLETARPDLEKYVPDDFAGLSDAAKQARSQFEQGNYGDALKGAQELPGKIQAAVEAAKAKKEELTAAWSEMSGSLPALVGTLTTKVNELAGMRRLPKGMNKATLEAAQTDLGSITEGWTAATAAFEGGDIPGAVSTAQDVKAKAEALAGTLGVAPAPPTGEGE